MIKTFYGQPSYYMTNGSVEVYTSVLGGNTTASFNLDGKSICPYFIAPWWNKPWLDLGADLLNVCRGSFFCLPMGGDPEGYSGKVIPVHGNCANQNWEMYGLLEDEGSKTLALRFEENDAASIKKEIMIKKGQTVLYEKHMLDGYKGDYPVAYHPMIKLPDTPGKAHLSISKPVDGYTTKQPHESPANGGYYLLKNDTQINDMRCVPTIYGDHEDLTSQPIRKGFEDIVMFISDRNKAFCYTAITNIEEGYVYFQIKNPRELQSTMLWISNGGRHYPPWNGRTTSVIGLEETTSYYHYGLEQSVQSNFINELGYQTSCFLDGEQKDFKLISGIALTPLGFEGVKEIKKDENGIVIIGLSGQGISIALDIEYLN